MTHASKTRTVLITAAAWVFGLSWALPVVYSLWAAFHQSAYATHFDIAAPLTLDNFVHAWHAAPFPRYFANTIFLVLGIMAAQFVICTLAAFGLARWKFFGSDILFGLVLVQLMATPDVLILENYKTLQKLGLIDTLTGVGLPYVASAFGIFLLRQTFKSIPKELDDAARMEGASTLQTIWRVYLPLARPIYVAYGLVSVSIALAAGWAAPAYARSFPGEVGAGSPIRKRERTKASTIRAVILSGGLS